MQARDEYEEIIEIIKGGFSEQIAHYSPPTGYTMRNIKLSNHRQLIRTTILLDGSLPIIHTFTAACLSDGVKVSIKATIEEEQDNKPKPLQMTHIKHHNPAWTFGVENYAYSDPGLIENIFARHQRWLKEAH
jgi:hypothetical protein